VIWQNNDVSKTGERAWRKIAQRQVMLEGARL
jgi:hypothetical protein